MKIIVDTNIIFSGLLNTSGKIGDLLFNSSGIFEFYSCAYMRIEIENHWEKLKRISKLTDVQLKESHLKVYSKINFITEGLIPAKVWILSEKIASDIDIDDSDFIALTKYLNGSLWTGDKSLHKGLKKKNLQEFLILLNYSN